MTEERALEIFRALQMTGVSLQRDQRLANGDPFNYSVTVLARPLSGRQISSIFKAAEASGCELGIKVANGEPWLVIDEPEAEPVPAVTPRG